MDSKLGPPPSSSVDDESAPPPPAYSESVAGSSTNTHSRPDEKHQSFSNTTLNAQHYSAQIQQQLSKLNTTMTTIQTQKSILTSVQDDKILALLTPEIQLFLSDFSISDFSRGTLILAPRAGLKNDESAIPPEFLERKDQFDRVVRLGDRDEEFHRTREEYGYGYEEEVETGDLLFWRDEALAKRLATYLRPAREPRPRAPKELPPRQEEVKAMQQPVKGTSGFGRSFWGRKKEVALPPPPPVVEQPRMDVKSKAPQAPEPVEDKVIMDVKGEEVYFQTKNDFGLLGSTTGYCIVLKLRVVLG